MVWIREQFGTDPHLIWHCFRSESPAPTLQRQENLWRRVNAPRGQRRFELRNQKFATLTLVPMLAASPGAPESARTPWGRQVLSVLAGFFQGLDRAYASLLASALANRGSLLLGVTVLFAASIMLALTIGTEFMPFRWAKVGVA